MSSNETRGLNSLKRKDSIKKKQLSDDSFQKIRQFFYERTGNWLSDEKRYLMLYRLSSLIGEGKEFPSFEALYDCIFKSPYSPQAKMVITKLTTHYSFFFREMEHFLFFQKYLIEEHNPRKELRVWSGACSTGEEVYSLAICAILGLPKYFHKVKILGTDISRDAILKAKEGIYNPGPLKSSVGPDLQKEFFQPLDTRWQVQPKLKALTHFAQLNLMEAYPFKKKFHFIFLRNIFYYMNLENRRKILEKITPYLKPGGYLIIGRMDSAPLSGFPYKSKGDCIYQKK